MTQLTKTRLKIKTLARLHLKQPTKVLIGNTLVMLCCFGLCVLATHHAWGSDVKELGEKLGEVKELFTGAGFKAGMGIATVIGMIFAAGKVSMSAALGVMGIGIAANYYLSWLVG